MAKLTYNLQLPENRTTSVIFAAPHSGRNYPWFFLRKSVLNNLKIRSSEDAFVDMLFADAPSFGAPFLSALTPRAYVDLNRNCDELDPALIQGYRSTSYNPRVASGLGVIPRVVSNGRAIYRGKISRLDVDERLKTHWHPYHNILSDLMDQNRQNFGQSILIDCHSMPHEAIDNVTKIGHSRAEVVLGDRFGAAAGENIVDRIENIFTSAGLKVVRNAPFAGAYISQKYGQPEQGKHAVQIEIDRSLYMNEQKIQPNGNFSNFKALISNVAAEIAAIGKQDLALVAE